MTKHITAATLIVTLAGCSPPANVAPPKSHVDAVSVAKGLDAIHKHDCVALAQLLRSRLGHDNVGFLLLEAVEGRDVAAVKLLLNGWADPNYNAGGSTSTPLNSACRVGSPEITNLLLHHGADPNILSTYEPPSSFPLYEATVSGCEPCVASLLVAGAKPNMRTRIRHDGLFDPSCTLGLTPLMVASMRCESGIARRLVDGGADLTLTDDVGYTARMWAEACQSRVNEMKGLLDQIRKRD